MLTEIPMMRLKSALVACVPLSLVLAAPAARGAEASSEGGTVPVGVARIDITPSFPVRLVGYASRTTESEGVAMKIWAKALAVGGDSGEGPAVLMMVENCGVPASLTEDVAAYLKDKFGVKRERFVVASTHIHTGPWLEGFIPLHFTRAIPDEHRQHMRQYTAQLREAMKKVAAEALASRKPGRLAWAQGTLPFAINRRVVQNGKWVKIGLNPEGPVDHSMPLLRVTDEKGRLMAVVVNYACHCTTLGGQHNKIHGDWAGCAQQRIEAEHPGVTAMITLGCGGDANPEPRGDWALAEEHGREVLAEVDRLLAGPMKPIQPALSARFQRIQLPFGKLPTREELVADAKKSDIKGNLAKMLLAGLDRGEPIPDKLDYSVAVWTFGNDLAMVFLPGEVVVDYVLRLKRELDPARLWVSAYSNDVPCYIASKRLLPEGGYEVDSSMMSYGRPARLAPEAEDLIIQTVHRLMPREFERSSKGVSPQ